MKKIIKKKLISVCKQILQEYVDKTHIADNNHCVLCQIYRKRLFSKDECDDCIMDVFRSSKRAEVGCLLRKCRPITSSSPLTTNKETRMVIKFYTLVVKRLELMSQEDMNEPNAFKFLKDIDKAVYSKYKSPHKP